MYLAYTSLCNFNPKLLVSVFDGIINFNVGKIEFLSDKQRKIALNELLTDANVKIELIIVL